MSPLSIDTCGGEATPSRQWHYAMTSYRFRRDGHLAELKQLRKAFDDAPMDLITHQAPAQYRDRRTGKVRANREIALLSHIFSLAREWGITDRPNPATGIRRNKETPRDFYAQLEETSHLLFIGVITRAVA